MRICFYSGYRDLTGGFTTLLLTLISELAFMQQEVVLINYKKGLIAEELKKRNIDIQIIDLDTTSWKNMGQFIFSTDVFVIVKFVEPYRHLLKINPRIVYYDINDFICQISDYKYGWKFPALGQKLVRELLAKNGLIFMDDTGLFNLKKYFSLDIADPVFLPIPVSIPGENFYLLKEFCETGTYHLTYVGRSVDWKMRPLKKILQDCAHAKVTNKIRFTIVVDSITEFRKFIQTENYSNYKHLSIELIENIPPSAINDFLLKHSHLHFAMGTAALDAAKLGIPTVLVDYSVSDFPLTYQYKLVFETLNFSLGKNLDKIKHSGQTSFSELIEGISHKDKRDKLSALSYKYTQDNHDAQKVATHLIAICKKSSFRLSEAKKYIPYYFEVHRLFKRFAGIFIKSAE